MILFPPKCILQIRDYIIVGRREDLGGLLSSLMVLKMSRRVCDQPFPLVWKRCKCFFGSPTCPGCRPLTRVTPTHPEEFFGRARVQSAIGNVRLLGQILCTLNGGNHPLHSEEGSQISRVGRDYDEGEEPPHSSYDSTR